MNSLQGPNKFEDKNQNYLCIRKYQTLAILIHKFQDQIKKTGSSESIRNIQKSNQEFQ